MKNALKIAGVLSILALSIVIQADDTSQARLPAQVDVQPATADIPTIPPSKQATKKSTPLNAYTRYAEILPDCSTVNPSNNIVHLACNVFWEARGEDMSSKVSVAILTVNRVEHAYYPETVHSVVWERRPGPQFSWTSDGKSDQVPETEREAWRESVWVARLIWTAFNDPNFDVQVGEIDLSHATHYHADYVSPRWARKMVRVGVIGRHIFYCDPQISDCTENT